MAQQHIKTISPQTSRSIPSGPSIPRSMQWFLLILIAFWVFSAMVLPVIAFYLTKNPLCFSLTSSLAPPLYILYRITRYLFPKNEKDYELEKTRIEHIKDKK